MYSKIFNKLFDYYIGKNKEICLRRPDVKTENKVINDTPTSEVTTLEPTEDYEVKKNIFGDLVVRSKK